MEEFFLDYKGFRPADIVRSFLDTKMKELQDVSPSGSTLKASFSRQSRMVEGSVKIKSAVGEFNAVAAGKHLKDVTRRLSEQIKSQLNRWKSVRFQDEDKI